MNIVNMLFIKPLHNLKLCFLVFCFGSVILFFMKNYKLVYSIQIRPVLESTTVSTLVYYPDEFEDVVAQFYNNRMNLQTLNLGKLMFQNATLNDLNIQPDSKKEYVILIWTPPGWPKPRRTPSSNNTIKSTFECSVQNCRFSTSDEELSTADAVLVRIQRGRIPQLAERKREQIWIFLTDESPKNAFSLSKRRPSINELASVFNWSASYRSISDVPVPYGRTVPLTKPLIKNMTSKTLRSLIPNWELKQTKVLVTILMSNCVKNRTRLVQKLNEYVKIDGYGGCFEKKKKACPGHFKTDCPVISNYLFYLVLENSLCDEYLSEKVFYNAYTKGAIPIIKGPPKDACDQLLPPNSYLHIDDFSTLEDLGKKIIEISKDLNKILKYHEWRNYFEVTNEHGFFGNKSRRNCRICEALNYNDRKEKVYDIEHLRPYFDSRYSCQ